MWQLQSFFQREFMRNAPSFGDTKAPTRSHRSCNLERLEDRFALSTAPFFMGIGDLPGGDIRSIAAEVSNDGSTVVGRSSSVLSGSGGLAYEAFRWTVAEGIQPLGILDGAGSSAANGVNYDGSVIVGYSPDGVSEAFRWTATTGMVALPLAQNATGMGNTDIGSAFGVSNDGSIISGYHQGVGAAVLWTSEGITELPPLSSGFGLGRAINGDGTVVVGQANNEFGVSEAYRWSEQTGTVGLGTLGDATGVTTTFSIARGVSDDGEVVVGYSQRPLNKKGNRTTHEAFRWTADDGMVSLGTLGADTSAARAASADGSIIVGNSGGAFIWDAEHGMRNLQQVLVDDYGLDLSGWELTTAYDIATDGHTIVGQGTNPQGFTEGWIARLGDPTPQPGITVTPTAGIETREDGTTAAFTVVLDTAPAAPVTVDVSSSDSSEGTIVGALGGVLTLAFNDTNWDVPQTVTVQGVDDTNQDGDQAYMIQLAPAVSLDLAYNGLNAADVSATNLDNEVPPPTTNIVYAWELTHTARSRGKHTDIRFFVDVNQDSNFDGLASSSDSAAADALVTVALYDSSGASVGTYTGTTDSEGIFRTDWIRGLESDTYTAEVVDLALADFDWTQLLGLGGLFHDDADGDGLPDELFRIG